MSAACALVQARAHAARRAASACLQRFSCCTLWTRQQRPRAAPGGRPLAPTRPRAVQVAACWRPAGRHAHPAARRISHTDAAQTLAALQLLHRCECHQPRVHIWHLDALCRRVQPRVRRSCGHDPPAAALRRRHTMRSSLLEDPLLRFRWAHHAPLPTAGQPAGCLEASLLAPRWDSWRAAS